MLSWDEIRSRIAGNSQDLLTQLGTQITKEVCAVYNRSPLGWTVAPIVRLAMKNGCAIVGTPVQGDTNLPEGGQCYTTYRLHGTYINSSKRFGANAVGLTFYWGTAQTVTGKIVSVSIDQELARITVVVESETGLKTTVNRAINRKFNDGNSVSGDQVLYSQDTTDTSQSTGYNFLFTRFQRTDGLPDDCHIQPPNVTEEDRRGSITINNYNEGDTTIEGEDVEYFIENDFSSNEFKFPITVNLGGNTVTLDLGGIEINRNNNEFSVEYNRRGGGGGYPGNLPPPNADNSEEEGVEEEDEKKIYKKREKPPEEGTEETGIDKLDYLEIDITTVPSNASVQDGSPGNDIYYPGFAEFKSGVYNFPRIPLHFRRNMLRAPDGADGYAVRIYPGFKGKTTVYYRKV